MKTNLILSLFFITGFANAQNWTPLNVSDKYNFQINTSDYISHTLWVDSISVIGSDSIFYLNRIVKECPGCSSNPNLYPLIKNQEQFLQKKIVKKPGNLYCFQDPTSFCIAVSAGLNDTWLFDSLNNIYAEITSLEEQLVFGILDSVKNISLSTGDVIVLSKNYGLLQFPDFENGGVYELKGIEGRNIGILVPNFWSYFDFEIGDVFQYKSRYSWATSWDSYVLNRLTILSKEISGDTISYIVHHKDLITDYIDGSQNISAYEYSDVIYYIDSASHITNLFPSQLIRLEEGCDYDEAGNFLEVYLDSIGLPTKTMGNFELTFLVWSIVPESDTLLPYSGANYHDAYAPGLGHISHIDYCFETYEDHILIGYVKDGDTTGIVYSDAELSVSLSQLHSSNQELYLFPNPTKDYCFVSLKKPAVENYHLSIIDWNGRLLLSSYIEKGMKTIEIDVAEFPDGMYVVVIEGESRKIMTKLLKY